MKAMKSLILCFVLLCGAAVLGAQVPEWEWAVDTGGIGGGGAWSVAIDSQGNLYVTGQFGNTTTFGSHTLTANGYGDIFVAKLDPSGNWLWAVNAGGNREDLGYGIAVDDAGNACVTGYFKDTATFGSHTLTASGNTDIFVAKIDPSGNWLMAVKAGGTSGDEGYGIAVDGGENAYVTGRFEGTATFGSHTLTSDGDRDIFAAKLDPSGNWLWAVKAGGDSSYERGQDIAVDGVGNAFVTGRFYGTATFGSHTLTASGNTDIFAAKLDPSGNWLWAVKAGGTDIDYGYGIALDGTGNIYVTGEFFGTATFGSHTLTASVGSDIFVAKLDPSGNWLMAVKAGGTSFCVGLGIVVDDAGNAYVTGRFEGTATFGSHNLTSDGDRDIFAAKLDPSGNWLWAVKGIVGEDLDVHILEGVDIVVDGVGNAYVTGMFFVTATFGSHTLASNYYAYPDIFVAKLGSGTPVEDDLAPETVARLYNAWPNPLGRGASALIKADITEGSTGTLTIFNLRGQMVARYELGPGPHQMSFCGDDLTAGIYLYSLQCGAYRETKKLVLLK